MLRSTQITTLLLNKWKEAITEEEFKLISDFVKGLIQPKNDDVFPNLTLVPNFGMCNFIGRERVSGKAMYKCVKVFNKNNLDGKIDAPWHNVLHLSEWGALYKSPLHKKTRDLLWRMLHGTIAVNAFVSVINQEVNQQRETVFHTFMYCTRLRPLFNKIYLDVLMNCFQ